MGFTPHKRVESTDSNDFFCLFSVFEFFSYYSGSAINIKSTGATLSVKKSLFRFCFSIDQGGAIYISSKGILLSDVCFDSCYITLALANVFGNAIYAEGSGKFEMNRTSFLCCGPDINRSADSTVFSKEFEFSSKGSNYSRCESFNGPSLISQSSSFEYHT